MERSQSDTRGSRMAPHTEPPQSLDALFKVGGEVDGVPIGPGAKWHKSTQLYWVAARGSDEQRRDAVMAIRETAGSAGISTLLDDPKNVRTNTLAVEAMGQLALAGDGPARAYLCTALGLSESNSQAEGLKNQHDLREKIIREAFGGSAEKMPSVISYLNQTPGTLSAVLRANPEAANRLAYHAHLAPTTLTRCELFGAIADLPGERFAEARKSALSGLREQGEMGLKELIRILGNGGESKQATEATVMSHLSKRPEDSAALCDANLLRRLDFDSIQKIMPVLAQNGQVSTLGRIAEDSAQPPWIREEAAKSLFTISRNHVKFPFGSDEQVKLPEMLKQVALSYRGIDADISAQAAEALSTASPAKVALQAALEITRQTIDLNPRVARAAMRSAAALADNLGGSERRSVMNYLSEIRRSFSPSAKEAAEALSLFGVEGRAYSTLSFFGKAVDFGRDVLGLKRAA